MVEIVGLTVRCFCNVYAIEVNLDIIYGVN